MFNKIGRSDAVAVLVRGIQSTKMLKEQELANDPKEKEHTKRK